MSLLDQPQCTGGRARALPDLNDLFELSPELANGGKQLKIDLFGHVFAHEVAARSAGQARPHTAVAASCKDTQAALFPRPANENTWSNRTWFEINFHSSATTDRPQAKRQVMLCEGLESGVLLRRTAIGPDFEVSALLKRSVE
ncbi:hypothetical protein [Bradyrhizobium canariense]|uniref:hypothetical protein n=1 Tax=Bradyrhizobium canariense TaxID=255045 RepID=UPI001178777F|nr:hypothetical protein [Bradyrhizobium canariense]